MNWKFQCSVFNSKFWIEICTIWCSIQNFEMKFTISDVQFKILNWNTPSLIFNSKFWIEIYNLWFSIQDFESKVQSWYFGHWLYKCFSSSKPFGLFNLLKKLWSQTYAGDCFGIVTSILDTACTCYRLWEKIQHRAGSCGAACSGLNIINLKPMKAKLRKPIKAKLRKPVQATQRHFFHLRWSCLKWNICKPWHPQTCTFCPLCSEVPLNSCALKVCAEPSPTPSAHQFGSCGPRLPSCCTIHLSSLWLDPGIWVWEEQHIQLEALGKFCWLMTLIIDQSLNPIGATKMRKYKDVYKKCQGTV